MRKLVRACVIKEVQHSMKWNFGGEGQVTVLENISYVNVGRAITRLKSLCTLTIFEKAFSIIVIHVQGTSKCKNMALLKMIVVHHTFLTIYLTKKYGIWA